MTQYMRFKKSGFSFDLLNPFGKRNERLQLKDGSTVVIIGGGPSGSFLAINLIRRAKSLGRKIVVVIMEKKKIINISKQNNSECDIGECNYCAGGLSPKICEALNKMGLI